MCDEMLYIKQETHGEKIGFMRDEKDELIMYTPPFKTATFEKVCEFFLNSREVLLKMSDDELSRVAARVSGWIQSVNADAILPHDWHCHSVAVEMDDGEYLVSQVWYNPIEDEATYDIPSPYSEYIKMLDDNRLETYIAVALSRPRLRTTTHLHEGGPLFATGGIGWLSRPVFFVEDEDGNVVVTCDNYAPIKTEVKFTDKWQALSGLLNHGLLGDPTKPAVPELGDDIPF